MGSRVQLAVLNPGGNDREQSFPERAGAPDDAAPHPPLNYHAYAACTGGAFYRDPARIPAAQRVVLLVLRRDLKHCLAALRQLKGEGRTVAMSLKESGLHQVAELLGKAGNLRLFREICATADGCLSSTEDLTGIYRAAGGRRVCFIPTPYPVESSEWNFALPLAERAGIFVGTREWDIPSRNHAAALLLAASLDAPVTVINEDGRAGRKRIDAAGIAKVQVIEGRLPYPDYLRLIARHRIVLQLDRSAVPGQVAGDALLCGVPCVGGDGAIERIAFPDSCGLGRGVEELREIAALLLRDDPAHTSAVERSRQIALERLSFPAVSQELAGYFSGLGAPATA
jgi:hypothetical protein